MRLHDGLALGFFVTLGSGCVDRTSVPASETSSSATSAGSSETSTSTGTSETETGTGTETGELPDPPPSPCDCGEDELCVADCSLIGLGFPPGDSMPENVRCLSDPACPIGGGFEDFDNPACREVACGSPYYWLEFACESGQDPPGIDIKCSAFDRFACEIAGFEFNECPDGEKCVPQPLDEEGLLTSDCRPSIGNGAPGDPCTRNEDLDDDCGVDSLCWPGELVSGPLEGTCRAYCFGGCPMGTTCQLLDPDGIVELCMPDP